MNEGERAAERCRAFGLRDRYVGAFAKGWGGGGCYLRGARDSCHRGCSGCVSLDGISRRRRS